MAATNSTPVPWHAAFPIPSGTAKSITRDEVLEMMKTNSSRDYLLVDLRRADHEGGTIRDSINLPAQSLYPSIPLLYRMFKSFGILKVIWYCSSSRGRGPRAAGWFNDYLATRGDAEIQSLVLSEGIRGWATAGEEFVSWMDEYDASVWAEK